MRNIIAMGMIMFVSACSAVSAADKPASTAFSAVLIQGNAKVFTAEEAKVGTVTLTQSGTGAVLTLKVAGLPAGTYGMHIHETGKCEGPAYKSAGAHWNPGAKQHGLQNPAGTHNGDLANLVVTNGKVTRLRRQLAGLKLTGDGGLMDADGAAFIIHALPDDNKTDPSGNSGDRIICGVLRAI